MARADEAGKVLPHMAKLGVTALQDMVEVSKELRKLAPMMPGMVGQVDEVLFESRAIIAQAERHWLLGSYLKPSAQQPLLVPSGIRDRPSTKPLSQLRKELGGPGTGAPSKAVQNSAVQNSAVQNSAVQNKRETSKPKVTHPGAPKSQP